MTPSDVAHEVGRPELGLWSLLYGVLGAPLAWALHLFLSYVLVVMGCNIAWGGTIPAILVATVVLAAAAFGSGVVSYRRWSRMEGEPRPWREALAEPTGEGGMLWMIGMLMAALFGIVIVLAGIAPLFVPLCGSYIGA